MSISTASPESLIRRRIGRQLWLVTAGTVTFAFGLFALLPLLPTIELFSISLFAAGMMMTVIFNLTTIVRCPAR